MENLVVSTDPNDLYYQDRLMTAKQFDKIEFAKFFEHRRTRVNDIDLHYVIGGSGPVVLFGHGWPASWYEWRNVLMLLKDNFTCIAFDMPGLGDSEPPPAFDDKTIADLLKDFIEQNLGLQELLVVCHDVSGPALITMAAYYPQMVKKLFITETALTGEALAPVLLQHLTEVWHFPVNAARLAPLMATGKEEQFIGQFFSKWLYNVGGLHHEDINEYVRTAKIPGVIESGAAYYHKPQQTLQGKPLTMPIHFLGATLGFGGRLGGEQKAALNTIAPFATNITDEVIEKCSHWVAEDRPVTLAHKIKEFFMR